MSTAPSGGSTAASSEVPTVPSESASASPTGEAPSASSAGDDVAKLIANVAGDPTPRGSELDVVWRSIMSDVEVAGAEAYEAPTRLVPYRGGELPDSQCAVGTAPRQWSENAFYCRSERAIHYDEIWLRDFAVHAGRYAPAAILAHEWGHHIQQVLGIIGFSIQKELQADCFAGLFLANTEEVLPGVTGPDDDLVATLKTFFEIGNSRYQSSLWFRPGEHGSPQQRIRAFGTGYTASFVSPGLPPPLGRGLAMCYGYKDFMVRDVGELPPYYRLLNLPGRSESSVGGAYVIAPENRLGFPTSAVLLEWLPGSTSADIDARLHERYPGVTTVPGPIDLATNVAPGTGFANAFEQHSAELPNGVRSGILGLVQPAAGRGGLAILVYRNAPMATEPPDGPELQVLQEQVALFYEVLARLCGPDDSGIIGEPNLKLTCLVDDQ